MVVAAALVLVLSVIALSTFNDVRPSTLALAEARVLASSALSEAQVSYRIERITFAETGEKLSLVLHLAPASPPVSPEVRAKLEGLAPAVAARIGYDSVRIEVAQP